jgi:hypothetical protein
MKFCNASLLQRGDCKHYTQVVKIITGTDCFLVFWSVWVRSRWWKASPSFLPLSRH